MIWIALLLAIILFNMITSASMFEFFRSNLNTLKKNLTKLQIEERRKSNGIGMTEIMVLLTLQIFIINFIGWICVVVLYLRFPDLITQIYNTIWIIPGIVNSVALYKMMQMKNKMRGKK